MADRPVPGVVVVTHGQLATELLNAAEMIVGDLPACTAVSIGWHDDVTVAHAAIAAAIAKVDRGAEILITADGPDEVEAVTALAGLAARGFEDP